MSKQFQGTGSYTSALSVLCTTRCISYYGYECKVGVSRIRFRQIVEVIDYWSNSPNYNFLKVIHPDKAPGGLPDPLLIQLYLADDQALPPIRLNPILCRAPTGVACTASTAAASSCHLNRCAVAGLFSELLPSFSAAS